MDFEENPELEELLDKDIMELDEETRIKVQKYRSRKAKARRDSLHEDEGNEPDDVPGEGRDTEQTEDTSGDRGDIAIEDSKEAPSPAETDRYEGKRKISEIVSSRESGREVSRRGFLSHFGLGVAATTAAFATGAVGSTRFFFPNVLSNPPETFVAGTPEDYSPGQVSARYKDQYRVWIVHLGDRLVSILAICTHLGCTPNWLDSQGIYKCPCHGSGYYKNGVNFEGPAPRPMDRVGIRLNAQGKIVIDKGQIFRYSASPGWDSKDAYIKV